MTKAPTSIVIPAFNEEVALDSTLHKLVELNIHEACEIIVVDDGSEDQTSSIVEKYPVVLCKHAHNKGYGAALKTGIRRASGKYVILMDGDGQHDPASIAV